MHITVAGNIGSENDINKIISKTFQLDSTIRRCGYQSVFGKFYEDMQRWSFNLQVFS